ncbi:hypothetical protein ACRAWF_37795 [Streptomyces sp. L7]
MEHCERSGTGSGSVEAETSAPGTLDRERSRASFTLTALGHTTDEQQGVPTA